MPGRRLAAPVARHDRRKFPVGRRAEIADLKGTSPGLAGAMAPVPGAGSPFRNGRGKLVKELRRAGPCHGPPSPATAGDKAGSASRAAPSGRLPAMPAHPGQAAASASGPRPQTAKRRAIARPMPDRPAAGECGRHSSDARPPSRRQGAGPADRAGSAQGRCRRDLPSAMARSWSQDPFPPVRSLSVVEWAVSFPSLLPSVRETIPGALPAGLSCGPHLRRGGVPSSGRNAGRPRPLPRCA